MVMHRIDDQDRALVSAAVAEAEAGTDGEIVVAVAPISDPYRDAALQWSVLVLFLALAAYAAFPAFYLGLLDRIVGWGHVWSARELLTILFLALGLKFFGMRLLMAWMPLRLALVPGATKHRRVQRRALACFRVGIERRTRARTGVLLYVSLAERRAEIIADETIHSKVQPEVWGEAMAALVQAVKDGKIGEGMAAAVSRIGVVLAEHFPRSADDTNELSDRLIEL